VAHCTTKTWVPKVIALFVKQGTATTKEVAAVAGFSSHLTAMARCRQFGLKVVPVRRLSGRKILYQLSEIPSPESFKWNKKPSNHEISKHLLKRRKINVNTGCWEWQGYRNRAGYGCVRVNRCVQLVHRVSFEVHVRPLREGFFVLHHCDNPCCFNPDHLFEGTNQDNMDDAIAKGRHYSLCAKAKTHCPRGHEYTKENTCINRKAQRSCKECRRAATREWMRKKRIGNGIPV